MDLDQLLREKFTSPFRKGYHIEEGFTLSDIYPKFKKEIDNFAVRDDDVWICSFPKTGTTWAQEMIWLIVNNLDFEGAKQSLDLRSPFLEFSMVLDMKEKMETDPTFKPPPHRLDSVGNAKNQKSPRIIKTHMPFQLLPNDIKNGVKKPKIVYVTRNPKDTCVSYYHHCNLLENYTGTFEEFCELFLAGRLMFAPYWKHVLPFWNLRNSPNVLFLKYEDMKNDLPSVLRETAAFFKQPINDKQVEVLKNHLDFDSMKKNDAVNKAGRGKPNKGTFMRSGTVGGYKNAMSDECIKKFDTWIEDNTKNTDYII